jgi:hypothetical protein
LRRFTNPVGVHGFQIDDAGFAADADAVIPIVADVLIGRFVSEIATGE